MPASWVFIGLFALVIAGFGAMAWLTVVPSDAYTPAHGRLLDIADWMIKACIGALLGFAGARAGSRPAGPPSS